MKKDEKNVLDSRTIYSLAMSVILYEIINSEILSTQYFLGIIKPAFEIILTGLIIFLILRGASLAEVNNTSKEKILKYSDVIYALSFQTFLIYFIVILLFSIFGNIFNYLDISINLITKLLFFFVFFISMYIGMYIWKKNCVISQTKYPVYFYMAIWILYSFYIIMNF